MKLHIGNLSKTVTDAELKSLVVPFAEPTSLEIIKSSTGESKGFAFVEFATEDHAKAVITGLDGKEVNGGTLRVGVARPRKGDAPAAPQA